MQFKATIVSLFAVTALAAPSIDARGAEYKDLVMAVRQAPPPPPACDRLRCLGAFSPTIAACATALADGPLPALDVACFAAIAGQSAAPPAVCNGCF